MKISKVNSIVATEMLLNLYGLDVLKYNESDIEHLAELLQIVQPSLSTLQEQADANTIAQE